MKCKFEHDGDCCNSGATQYMCKCKQPCYEIIPMTNADRIRAMTDEELAEWLSDDDRVCPPKHPNCKKYVNSCKGCFLEWLQQPAEEKE